MPTKMCLFTCVMIKLMCGCCFWTLIASSLSGSWKNLDPGQHHQVSWGAHHRQSFESYLCSLIHQNICAEMFYFGQTVTPQSKTGNISSMIPAATSLSSFAFVDNCGRNQALAAWLVSAVRSYLQRQSGSGDLFKT